MAIKHINVTSSSELLRGKVDRHLTHLKQALLPDRPMKSHKPRNTNTGFFLTQLWQHKLHLLLEATVAQVTSLGL